MHENIACIPIFLNQTSASCLLPPPLFCTTERCMGKTEFTQLNMQPVKEKSCQRTKH